MPIDPDLKEKLDAIQSDIRIIKSRLDTTIVHDTDLKWIKAALKTLGAAVLSIIGWLVTKAFGGGA